MQVRTNKLRNNLLSLPGKKKKEKKNLWPCQVLVNGNSKSLLFVTFYGNATEKIKAV